MRVVVDTNVFVSALLSKSTPRLVYEAFLNGRIHPVLTPQTVSELTEVLTRPTLQVLTSHLEVKRMVKLLERDATLVYPRERVRICRDMKDNIILEAAVAGRVDCIITGDRDLLIIHRYRDIPILKPSDFLKRLG